MADPLDLESRRRIHAHVQSNPGTYLREMERSLGMAMGQLTYQLDRLESGNLVRSENDSGMLRYYPSEGYHQSDRRTVGLLRQRVPRSILMILIERDRSFSEIVTVTGLAKSSVSYQMGKMVRAGVVAREQRERTTWFSLTDRESVANHLIGLKDNLKDDAVDRFASLWESLRD